MRTPNNKFTLHLKELLAPFFAILLLSTLLQGCSLTPPLGDADNLRQRAQAYWKARVIGDRIAAWDYEELKVSGKSTLQAYAKMSGPLFTQVDVLEATITPDSHGKVKIDTRYTVPGLSMKHPIEQIMEEDWKWVEGNWYHVTKLVADVLKKQ